VLALAGWRAKERVRQCDIYCTKHTETDLEN